MSRLIAIILSAFILMQSFNFGADDVLQLDELITHASFHKQEHGDNFFVFLSKHYGELKAEHSKSHKEEQTDHEKLPFQCQGHTITLSVFSPIYSFIDSDNLEFYNLIEYNTHYINLYSSLHNKELLQPPKIA